MASLFTTNRSRPTVLADHLWSSLSVALFFFRVALCLAFSFATLRIPITTVGPLFRGTSNSGSGSGCSD